DRAVRIMGWGEGGIIRIPANERYQMRTDLLDHYYQQAQQEGKKVIAIVGSACSTSTGAYDDLEAIATFCQTKQLWFHVDGAHGAAVAFAPSFRSLIKGIEKADSVAMDLHKMLMTPALATALIFRNGQQSYRTFTQKAQYLFEQNDQAEWYNLARRTFECTKYMMSVKFYTLLRTYGTELFDEFVSKLYQSARQFARLLEEETDFEIATFPEANILCFRYLGSERGNYSLDDWNAQIRSKLIEEGTFYIVQTRLKKGLFLRVSVMNPFTSKADFETLIEHIRAISQKLAC
ncbi:MAG: pyridoxal-dependent decarboxylase, partial [Bacteroidota bacterium]